MSKELDIVLEKVYGHTDLTKVVREDTQIAMEKSSLMKEDWTSDNAVSHLTKGLGQYAHGNWSGGNKSINTSMTRAGKFLRKAASAAVDWADPDSLKPGADKQGAANRPGGDRVIRDPASDEAKKAAADLASQKAKNEPVYHAPGTGGALDAIDKASKDPSHKDYDAANKAIADVKQFAKDQPDKSKEAEKKAMDSGAPALPKDTWKQPEAPKTPEAPKQTTPEAPKQPEAPKADSPTAMSFKQAFAKARKEAGGAKGQFEYGGKKYQTNIAPAKGAEKYISAGKQKATSVKVAKPETPAPAPKADDNKPSATETTPKVEPLRNLRQQPPPEAGNLPKNRDDQEKSNAQGNDTYQKTRDALDSPEAAKERHDKEKSREDAANKVLEPAKKALDNVEKLPGGDTVKKFFGDVKPDTQKESAKLNECVQIGNYKYRII